MYIPFIKLILLLRIKKISLLFENLEETTSIREKFATFIDLGKLVYINIFVSHFCACSWHFIGMLEVSIKNGIINFRIKHMGIYLVVG